MKFWNVAHWVGMVTVGVLGSLKSKTLVADSAIRPAYTRLYIFVDWIWTSHPVCYDFHGSCISWQRLPPSIHQGMVCMTGGVPWEEERLTWMAQGVAMLFVKKLARSCAYLNWDEKPLFSRGWPLHGMWYMLLIFVWFFMLLMDCHFVFANLHGGPVGIPHRGTGTPGFAKPWGRERHGCRAADCNTWAFAKPCASIHLLFIWRSGLVR